MQTAHKGTAPGSTGCFYTWPVGSAKQGSMQTLGAITTTAGTLYKTLCCPSLTRVQPWSFPWPYLHSSAPFPQAAPHPKQSCSTTHTHTIGAANLRNPSGSSVEKEHDLITSMGLMKWLMHHNWVIQHCSFGSRGRTSISTLDVWTNTAFNRGVIAGEALQCSLGHR